MPLADDARKHASKVQDPATVAAVLGRNHVNDERPAEPAPTVTRNAEYGYADAETVNVPGLDPEDDGIVRNTESWEALPSIDYTGSGIEPTPPGSPLAQAWAAVMAEVQEIRKEGRFSGGGASYVYRGVDAVVNAVGPALRKHRVIILPIKMEPSYRDVSVGSKGTAMRECTMTVTYQIMGTTRETWTVVGQGESLDSGDKGTTKAGTVAFRNMLLTALAVPVDNPRLDADHTEYKRADQQQVQLPSPIALRDEALRPDVSFERLKQVYSDINPKSPNARFARLGHVIVANEENNEERLAYLIWRKMTEHPDRPKETAK